MLTNQFRYDLANRLIGITYPSGLVASYTRDAQGRVNGVSLARGAWALPLVTQVGYQPFGPMSSIAFGHGQTLAKQWDRNYEPDAITSPAIDYDYTLDDVGNLTRIQSAIEGEQRYGYDNLDRIESIREQNEALIESFAYDATGNRTSHTVGASTTSYSYPGSSHRLEQVGAQARAFDAAGNTVSGIAGSSFAFDARNRLVEVNAGGAIRQRMSYNGRGERVLSAEGNPAPAWPTTSSAWGQAAAAGVRATVYDEQGQVLTTLRGGNPLRFEEIIWIDSTPVARVESSTSAVLTVHAIHTDHLNTPRALVNAQTQGGQPAGTVVWRWRLINQGPSGSNAFGAMAAEEDPDGNGTTVRFDLRFPGQQYDASTGLHYNYFRDYEAQTGRYVESDPIGLRGGVSTYGYAGGMPLIAVDPTGEDFWIENGPTLGKGAGFHQHLCIGQPGRRYRNCYMFAVTPAHTDCCGPVGSPVVNSLIIVGDVLLMIGAVANGSVVEHNELRPGDSLARGSLRVTPREIDQQMINHMDALMNSGAWSNYNLAFNNCRTFAQQMHAFFSEHFPNSAPMTPNVPICIGRCGG